MAHSFRIQTHCGWEVKAAGGHIASIVRNERADRKWDKTTKM